eukprot:4513525-Lingulodinium_polyedra.AAC.1
MECEHSNCVIIEPLRTQNRRFSVGHGCARPQVRRASNPALARAPSLSICFSRPFVGQHHADRRGIHRILPHTFLEVRPLFIHAMMPP